MAHLGIKGALVVAHRIVESHNAFFGRAGLGLGDIAVMQLFRVQLVAVQYKKMDMGMGFVFVSKHHAQGVAVLLLKPLHRGLLPALVPLGVGVGKRSRVRRNAGQQHTVHVLAWRLAGTLFLGGGLALNLGKKGKHVPEVADQIGRALRCLDVVAIMHCAALR